MFVTDVRNIALTVIIIIITTIIIIIVVTVVIVVVLYPTHRPPVRNIDCKVGGFPDDQCWPLQLSVQSSLKN